MKKPIDNRQYRQKVMKEVIRELHHGKSVGEVKAKFASAIEGVSPKEIGEMEVQLVKEGLPIEDIQYLCDAHAVVFKESLGDIQHSEQVPGHSIYTMKEENQAISELIEETIKPNLDKFREDDSKENVSLLMGDFRK